MKYNVLEKIIQTFLSNEILKESGLKESEPKESGISLLDSGVIETEPKKSGISLLLIVNLYVNLYASVDVAEWGEPDTKLLLDKYEQYLDQIGPFKKFKNKKSIWVKISNDLKIILGVERTAIQCENRFKTVLKRKSKITKENDKSGAGRTDPEFDDELSKIKAKDDGVEPEMLVGVGEIKKNKIEKPRHEKEKEKPEDSQIAKVLYKIHEEKEKNKDRRHQEKIKLIEML